MSDDLLWLGCRWCGEAVELEKVKPEWPNRHVDCAVQLGSHRIFRITTKVQHTEDGPRIKKEPCGGQN